METFKNLIHWSDGEQVTSPSPLTTPTASNSTEVMSEYRATSSATLPALLIIAVIILVVAAAVFIHIKLRNRRRREKQSRSRMMMSTTNNAGVYVDLSPSEDAFSGTKHSSPQGSANQKLRNGEA